MCQLFRQQVGEVSDWTTNYKNILWNQKSSSAIFAASFKPLLLLIYFCFYF